MVEPELRGSRWSRSRFRRSQRILRSSEFVHVMRTGKRYNHAAFTLHVCPSNLGYARLGIAVGRRVSLKAHNRNTLKRIIRECFRREAQTLPPFDLVFNARPRAMQFSRTEFATEIIAALARVKQITLPSSIS